MCTKSVCPHVHTTPRNGCIRPSGAALGPLQPNWEPREHAWCWRKGGEVSMAAAERGEGAAGEVRAGHGDQKSTEGLWLLPEGVRAVRGPGEMPDRGVPLNMSYLLFLKMAAFLQWGHVGSWCHCGEPLPSCSGHSAGLWPHSEGASFWPCNGRPLLCPPSH